ncbi:MAG: hypothetical protein ACOY0T_18090 [Myxococcota bacterium]
MKVWVALVCSALALSSSVPATACVNDSGEGHLRGPDGSLFADEEQLIEQLKKAEDALRLSNYSMAAAELDVLKRRGEPTPRMRSRLARVSALIAVRTGGQWPLQRPKRANNAEARKKALRWAVRTLRQRATEVANDSVRQSDLGEALATLPNHAKEARALLERLATADLLTSAHAYQALARLRERAGDADGARNAHSRCLQLDSSQRACNETPKA